MIFDYTLGLLYTENSILILVREKCVNVPYQLNTVLGKAHSRARLEQVSILHPMFPNTCCPPGRDIKRFFIKITLIISLTHYKHTHTHNVKAIFFKFLIW